MSLLSSHHYLSRRPYPYQGHLLLLGRIHPSQLLHRKLRLIADDEVVARDVLRKQCCVVEYMTLLLVIGPIFRVTYPFTQMVFLDDCISDW